MWQWKTVCPAASPFWIVKSYWALYIVCNFFVTSWAVTNRSIVYTSVRSYNLGTHLLEQMRTWPYAEGLWLIKPNTFFLSRKIWELGISLPLKTISLIIFWLILLFRKNIVSNFRFKQNTFLNNKKKNDSRSFYFSIHNYKVKESSRND